MTIYTTTSQLGYIPFNYPDGNIVGTSNTAKISFYGATPVAQPSGTNQSAVVATTAITTVVTTAATNTSPFGFSTSTQANAIVAAVNSLIAQSAQTVVLLNQIRSDLVTLGTIKGSA